MTGNAEAILPEPSGIAPTFLTGAGTAGAVK
jgi:hypothetical protein